MSIHQGQAAGTHWEPQQYLKFADHRLRPALELLERLPLTSPACIYDLGCGTGQITRILAERWPAASVYGIDNSPEMLASAAATAGNVPVHWQEANIRDWQPTTAPDLIYSNATLQWLDDHQALFLRLLRQLAPGGCLAVQMPLSWDAPSHQLMRTTLADGGPAGTTLGSETLRQAVARRWVEETAQYYDWLAAATQTLDIWATEYLHVLTGPDPVLEWVKSTGLRPILNSLEEAQQAVFLAEYSRRLRIAYPPRPDGRTLYPFRRLFLVATV